MGVFLPYSLQGKIQFVYVGRGLPHAQLLLDDCGRKCLMQDRTDFEKAPLVPDDWADLEECVKALGKKDKILLFYFIRQYGCAELLENQKAAFDLLETARQEGSEATHRYPPRKT